MSRLTGDNSPDSLMERIRATLSEVKGVEPRYVNHVVSLVMRDIRIVEAELADEDDQP